MKLSWTTPGAVSYPPVVLPSTPANPLGAWRTEERTPPHYGVLGRVSTPGLVNGIGTTTQNRYSRTPVNPVGVYRSFADMANGGAANAGR